VAQLAVLGRQQVRHISKALLQLASDHDLHERRWLVAERTDRRDRPRTLKGERDARGERLDARR